MRSFLIIEKTSQIGLSRICCDSRIYVKELTEWIYQYSFKWAESGAFNPISIYYFLMFWWLKMLTEFRQYGQLQNINTVTAPRLPLSGNLRRCRLDFELPRQNCIWHGFKSTYRSNNVNTLSTGGVFCLVSTPSILPFVEYAILIAHQPSFIRFENSGWERDGEWVGCYQCFCVWQT
jgi:hypothetical protein